MEESRAGAYIVTFYSHFDAILANRTLISAGFAVQLMPVPRVVSASCGTCVKFTLAPECPFPGDMLAHVKVEHIYRQREFGWEQME